MRSEQEHLSPNQDKNNDDDWPSVRMPVAEAPDTFMKMSANNSSLLVNVIAINLIVVMLISFVLILFSLTNVYRHFVCSEKRQDCNIAGKMGTAPQ